MAVVGILPNWIEVHPLHQEMVNNGWRSPDAYSACFDDPVDGPALYMFRAYDQEDFSRAFIAYVGMATNVRRRLSGHEVLAKVRAAGFYVQRWFKPTPDLDLRVLERGLIERFDPPWNLIGRRRGVVLA